MRCCTRKSEHPSCLGHVLRFNQFGRFTLTAVRCAMPARFFVHRRTHAPWRGLFGSLHHLQSMHCVLCCRKIPNCLFKQPTSAKSCHCERLFLATCYMVVLPRRTEKNVIPRIPPYFSQALSRLAGRKIWRHICGVEHSGHGATASSPRGHNPQPR